MFKSMRNGVVLAVILMLTFSGSAIAKGKGNQNNPPVALTEQEVNDLIHLREEEKLARDVYRYLFDVWGQWIFDNIAASEQQHMDAVKNLLDRYGIEDPVGDDVEGVFANPTLQSLYDSLTAVGALSNVDALYVGATIEDLDIYDIQHMVANTDKPDLLSVYENLMKGSRNHMRSFCGLLETFGESYTAQYLTQEEVDAIVSSDRETGRQ